MSIFQVEMKFFYIISIIIYSCIFLLIPLLLWVKRKKVNGIKIMALGISLLTMSAVFFTEETFKYIFPLLNFLTLLFGALLVVVGFYISD